MRLALDTNRYVDFCRGDREVVDRVREAERIYLPLYARDRHFDRIPQLVRL
jgi:hypothetical protein